MLCWGLFWVNLLFFSTFLTDSTFLMLFLVLLEKIFHWILLFLVTLLCWVLCWVNLLFWVFFLDFWSLRTYMCSVGKLSNHLSPELIPESMKWRQGLMIKAITLKLWPTLRPSEIRKRTPYLFQKLWRCKVEGCKRMILE